MDFFSSGFQLLFSDLDHEDQDMNWECSEIMTTYDGSVVQNTDDGYSENNDTTNKNNNNNNNSSNYCYYTCDYYSYIDDDDQQRGESSSPTWTHLLSSDQNNNNVHQDSVDGYRHGIETELNLLPIETTQSEWEGKFLDNYIEIPELVEFLPEKTPLCNDLCDLFLTESSKNLQLFRSLPTEEATTVEMEKSFACTFGNCSKIYAKPAHLKAHLRRHLGEKPYVCTWPECTWKFSRSDELARHRRSHSGIKPYKCGYCTKCFARSDHLAKHRKVHERRLLAIGKNKSGILPSSNIFNVRPGRKPKNQTFS